MNKPIVWALACLLALGAVQAWAASVEMAPNGPVILIRK